MKRKAKTTLEVSGSRTEQEARFVPKPSLTFVVGITGHRSKRLKAGRRPLDRIAAQLAEVLRAIEEACAEERRKHAAWYAEAAPRMRLVSSLSDGADHMALAACPPHWKKVAVLPFPRKRALEALLRDQDGEEAAAVAAGFEAALEQVPEDDIVELPAEPVGPVKEDPSDESGLVRASRFMLRQIDLLVAVWDGSQTVTPGGTTGVVARALEAGIPVVWISSVEEQTPWLIARMSDVAHETPLADAREGPIAAAVAGVLGLRERGAGHGRGRSAEEQLAKFLAERRRTWCGSTAYRLLAVFPRLWLWSPVIRLPDLAATQAQWREFLATAPDGRGFAARLEHILLPRYAAADALATFFAHRYRSAYVLAYALSVLAVLVALLSFAPHDPREDALVHKAKYVAVELLPVLWIGAIILMGSFGHWHDRWLDYRALAEMLRHLRFLGLLGEYELRAFAETAARPGAGWVLWYLRATMRELGPPAGVLDESYQRRAIRAVEVAEVDDQIA
ncbi:MAG TPA: DUF4231 domain-containing protein [Beijerinckiaceae bacterium]|jgi:hypothetical protein